MQIARQSIVMLMRLAAVILYRLLISLELRRVALPATLAAALGSNLWTIGSQAMWQHGPAAFSSIVAIALSSSHAHFSVAADPGRGCHGVSLLLQTDRRPVRRCHGPVAGSDSA